MNKSLKYLLQEIVAIETNFDRPIKGLTQDSRQVQAGDLFFACPGAHHDGRDFIPAAIAKGATAILVAAKDNEKISVTNSDKIPVVTVPNLSKQIGPIAARFYDDPSRDLRIVGITGTNGKTSSAHFLAHTLQMGDELCGVIGTLGNGLYPQLQLGSYTTPDAIALQKMLAEFRDKHAKYVVMEVTSHALTQGRVEGVKFDTAVFTNLTRDHLDFHGNIANYANAKHSLFQMPGLRYGVLNADDSYGLSWLKELAPVLPVYSYSLQAHYPSVNTFPKIYVHHSQFDNNGFTASLHTPWGDGVLHNSNLVGRFNLSNLLAVTTVLGILGIPLEKILARMGQLRGVPGRMETFGGGEEKPLIVIDFAHTPDALEQVLSALNEHKQGLLWCVFGCGGDRDRGKRPIMGKIAEQYADRLIITDDNPRHEDPKEIVNEIYQGLEQPGKAVVEHDRRRAIAHAISCAGPKDIILIAGKGHETHQIIGDEREPFNDALEVQKILASTT